MRYERISSSLKVLGVLGVCLLFVYAVTFTITNKKFNSAEPKELLNIDDFEEDINKKIMEIWNEHKNSESFRDTRKVIVHELTNEVMDKVSQHTEMYPICPKCPIHECPTPECPVQECPTQECPVQKCPSSPSLN